MSRPEPQREAEVLEQLCAHFGISTQYQDSWGKLHPVAHDVLLALLREFDLDLDTADSPEERLDAIARSAWQQALPTVLAITSASEYWSLSLRLPASVQKIHWQLTDEAGVSRKGEADVHGLPEVTHTEIGGVHWSERTLSFGFGLAAGYHHFSVDALAGRTLIISAPPQCYRPAVLRQGGRIWGPAVQLYALRSQRNWGIGDFSDLLQLVRQMAERGADIVGLNPLHALFPHNPARASPYSPSSRQHLNVLYIDVEAVDDFVLCEPVQRLTRSAEFQARLTRLRATALVDYVGVAQVKSEALEMIFSHFCEHHLEPGGRTAVDASGRAFLGFVAQRGQVLYKHALFEALGEHFLPVDPRFLDWQSWPAAYQDVESAQAASFAEQHWRRIQYHQYLQWLAACQLAGVSELCQTLGLRVGLYLDLAVGVDRAGSDAWSQHPCLALQAGMGAPADAFNPKGQAWGLPAARPDRLRASHYRFFIETLRANMRGAGALRIDHVMGLMRLFWIPSDKTATEGTYVQYPFDEMMAIVALESQRNRCMVVGEDLGTVAGQMRDSLSRADVFSYRVLYFELKENGEFKPSVDYPANSLVSTGTHDLCPLAGWWTAQDLRLRLRLGLMSDQQEFERHLAGRVRQRARLLLALHQAGWLSKRELAQETRTPTLSGRCRRAIHAFLAATPSALMVVPLEDVLDIAEQVNVPGTVDEHPNWRRKLPWELEALAVNAEMIGVTRVLAQLRPRRMLAVTDNRDGERTGC